MESDFCMEIFIALIVPEKFMPLSSLADLQLNLSTVSPSTFFSF